MIIMVPTAFYWLNVLFALVGAWHLAGIFGEYLDKKFRKNAALKTGKDSRHVVVINGKVQLDD